MNQVDMVKLYFYSWSAGPALEPLVPLADAPRLPRLAALTGLNQYLVSVDYFDID